MKNRIKGLINHKLYLNLLAQINTTIVEVAKNATGSENDCDVIEFLVNTSSKLNPKSTVVMKHMTLFITSREFNGDDVFVEYTAELSTGDTVTGKGMAYDIIKDHSIVEDIIKITSLVDRNATLQLLAHADDLHECEVMNAVNYAFAFPIDNDFRAVGVCDTPFIRTKVLFEYYSNDMDDIPVIKEFEIDDFRIIDFSFDPVQYAYVQKDENEREIAESNEITYTITDGCEKKVVYTTIHYICPNMELKCPVFVDNAYIPLDMSEAYMPDDFVCKLELSDMADDAPEAKFMNEHKDFVNELFSKDWTPETTVEDPETDMEVFLMVLNGFIF